MYTMKKTVGIITFHASHNYGSMLQAYALQQVILSLGFECEIINFRTLRQKTFYKPIWERGNIFGKFKRLLLYAPFHNKLLKKHQLFEEFLQTEFRLSKKEYATLQDLEQANLRYDYYISGSDQIWNTNCFDFDWAYFLPFVENGERIAYAPSMGPNPHKVVSENNATKIKELLSPYKVISVREKETAERIKHFTGKDYPVMLDPTLLLTSADWSEIINEQPLIKGKYIFLYTPWFDEATFKTAQSLSQQLGLPIVVSQLYRGWKSNKWIVHPEFHLHLATGPKEFLNLCKHATCIIGASFHLVVFSILLKVPFYTINGMKDSRIANLLSITELDNRSIDPSKGLETPSLEMDFENAIQQIEKERAKSINWLKQNIV